LKLTRYPNTSLVIPSKCGILIVVKILTNGLNHNAPGGATDSWCGKCKMILAHTIEAMVGDQPARVTCNTCKSQHNYKAQAPGTARTFSKPAQSRKRTTTYQSLMKAKEATAARAYSVTATYALGDFLDHPTFGRGVATAVKDGAKIEVLFESGSRTLIHSR
jgi:hypothetical protein